MIEDAGTPLHMGYEYNLGILFGRCPLESVYLGRDLEYNYVIQGDRSPFYGITTLRDLTIGGSVTKIDEFCFYGCTGLTSVSIPASVTAIGNYAFRGSGLTSVRMDDGEALLTLGISVFDEAPLASLYQGNNMEAEIRAPYLTDLRFGPAVTRICDGAFPDCTSLTSVNLPEGITSIGDQAFINAGLTTLTTPASLRNIGMDAFRGCCALTTVALNDELSELGFGAFRLCQSLKQVNIPLSLSTIESETFAETALETVDIPGHIEVVDSFAFTNCNALRAVTIADGVTAIKGGVFSDCGQLGTLTLPASLRTIGHEAFHNCEALTSVALPAGLKRLEDDVFSGCSSLSTVRLNPGLEVIGEDAFADCRSLTAITLPPSVKRIGNEAFTGTTLLSVTSQAATPPEAAADAFDPVHYMNALLTVPVGHAADYAAAPCWMNFQRRAETVVDGIHTPHDAAGSPTVRIHGLTLTVEGTQGAVEVYDTGGTLVARSRSGQSITLPQSGIYVVRTAGGTLKVAL